MSRKHLWILLVITTLPLRQIAPLEAQVATADPSTSGAGGIGTLATTVGSAQFVLTSEYTGREYLIQVGFPIPSSPDGSPNMDEAYPVLYALDGQTSFGLFTAMARLLQLEGSIRPTLVVAVSHRFDTVAQGMELRAEDYVHRAVPVQLGGPPVMGGGGGALESFLNEQLRPYIEANFPVDADQSFLAGHSLGGLFASTLLANGPDRFRGYMIASPSLQYDPQLVSRIAQVASDGRGRRVFISVGGAEPPIMASAAAALEGTLGSGTSTFEVERYTAAGESHFSVLAPFVSHGLQYLFPPVSP